MSNAESLEVIANLLDEQVKHDTGSSSFYLELYKSYVDFWTAESRVARRMKQAARSDDELIMFMAVIAERLNHSREDIQERLGKQYPFADKENIARSVNLAVRKWLMLNLRDTSYENRLQWHRTASIHWRQEESLNELMQRVFPAPTITVLSGSPVYFDGSFNACKIMRFADCKISWTHSIEDHLRFRFEGGDRSLRIFSHKQWLIRQVQGPAGRIIRGKSVIPVNVLRELIWTLDLLFPASEDSVSRFLNEQKPPQTSLLVPFVEGPPTELRFYHYWRERLYGIHCEVNAPPRSLRAALMDYRSPLSWWTFWIASFIAIMTLVFGILATAFAILQWKRS